MNLFQLQGALELGLVYSLVALGVYLSFRILQFPDMTVDGSFPFGAAVCAALMTHGMNPLASTLLAVLGGCVAGLVTATLSTHLKTLNLLAGILNMSALYSVNLRVMGSKPNLSLLGQKTLFTYAADLLPTQIPYVLCILLLLVAGTSWGLCWFLKTQIGLALRSVGNNPRMARSHGVSDSTMIQLGLAISNGLVALSGALFAQIYNFADVSMGIGTITVGLASVIIGETLFRHSTIWLSILACIGGSVLYRLLIAGALNLGEFGLEASDLNLITAVLVTLAILMKTSLRRTA